MKYSIGIELIIMKSLEILENVTSA